MATEILAVGTNGADSADVVVAEGTQLTVSLKGETGKVIDPRAYVEIQLKDDANQYWTVSGLSGGIPATAIVAAGTYRFRRLSIVACGVFSG